jgi:hypothetical protein
LPASADSEKLVNPSNGHSYQRFDTAKTWSEAKDACETQDAHLATITSSEENNWTWSSFGASAGSYVYGGKGFWLGGTDATVEGQWTWVTGEPWDYSNWSIGQPDNYDRGQDYAFMWDYIAGSWDDGGPPWSDLKASYLCEWENSTDSGPLPQIDSITPVTAILDQPTQFTLTGSGLNDGMAFGVTDCANPQELGPGSDTERRFECTPTGKAGRKAGQLKTAPDGALAYSFDVEVQPEASGLPLIVDVSPSRATLNKLTEFTVTGGNLSKGMGFALADCASPNREDIAKATPTSRTFVCKPQSEGRKSGVVKTAPNQLAVHDFTVEVGRNSAPASLGQVQFNPRLVALSGAQLARLQTLTDTSVSFKPAPAAVAGLRTGSLFLLGSLPRKVSTIRTNADGATVISTAIPTPGELFAAINLEGALAIDASHYVTDSLPRTVSLRTSASSRGAAKAPKDTFTFTFKKHLLLDANDPGAPRGSLVLNGGFVLKQPRLTLNVQHEQLGFLSYPTRTQLAFSADQQISRLSLSAPELLLGANREIPLGRFNVPVPAEGATVVATVELSLLFDGAGQASIKGLLEQTATVDTGFTAALDLDTLTPGFTPQNQSEAMLMMLEPKLSGQAKLSLGLRTAVSLKVQGYDLAGLVQNAGPQFTFDQTGRSEDGCTTFSADVGLDGAAYTLMPEIGANSWQEFQQTLVKKTARLFHSSLYSWKPATLNSCAE